MQNLTDRDVERCLAKLPNWLRSRLIERKEASAIAGGFIRDTILGKSPKDIDIFQQAGSSNFSLYLLPAIIQKEIIKSIVTDKAVTLQLIDRETPLLQFIVNWKYLSHPTDLLKMFDFTICKAVIWWDGGSCTWRSCCADTFYQDIAAKELVFETPSCSNKPGSLTRMLRFYQRGYWATAETVAKVIEACMTSLGVSIIGEVLKSFTELLSGTATSGPCTDESDDYDS